MKQARSPSAQSGLSLIELMVAMTLGLMITTTLGYILMGSRSTYRTQDASARVQDTGRFALEFIGRQLRSAGRTDITPLASDGRIGLPGGAVPIMGTDGDVTVNTGGTPATRSVDNLTLQYQLSDMGGAAIADCNGAGVATTVIPGTAPAAHYGTVTNTISLNAGTLELRCEGNGGGGAQPFAEGVEDMQFRYAEQGAPSTFNSTPLVWTNVVAVQVCIMVRSLGNGVVNAPQPITDCSGNTYTPNDTRLRRTFTSVFTLRNRINTVP